MAKSAKGKGAKSTPTREVTCTPEELMSIITAPSGGFVMSPSEAYDEVYPGIFIGDESTAKNVYLLERLGITHVLNAAIGPKDRWHVNISPVHYQRKKIKQLGVKATDIMNCNIAQHFDTACTFITEALEEGKVLVHCREGRSRSTTLVLAYLMKNCHMTAHDAMRTVRAKREVCPNQGFLQQLCHLNDKLTEQGHFQKEDSHH